MKTVNESIFSGEKHIIPMADVLFVEKHWFSTDEKTPENIRGYLVIMKGTTWSPEIDTYNNNAYLSQSEGKKFLEAWCVYRHELEANVGEILTIDPNCQKGEGHG